jgi:site-specific recombinase XerD
VAYRNDLERTDASKGRTSFATVLDAYRRRVNLEKKRAVIAKLRATWFGLHSLPLRAMQFSDVKRWLSEHYAEKSASYYNSALSVVRSALEVAVNDKIISESPAKDLTYRKRKKPIRPTPTFEQFKQIVASIRAPPVKYWEIIADRLHAEG